MLMGFLLGVWLAGASPDLGPGQRRLAKGPIDWTLEIGPDVFSLLAIVGHDDRPPRSLERPRGRLGAGAS